MSDTKETRIHIKIGNFILYADLNCTSAAKDLISRLPVTLTLTSSGKEFYGELESACADEKEMQYGWNKGDMGYRGNTLTIFCFNAPENNQNKEMIIGHISEVYLNTLMSCIESGASAEMTISRKSN